MLSLSLSSFHFSDHFLESRSRQTKKIISITNWFFGQCFLLSNLLFGPAEIGFLVVVCCTRFSSSGLAFGWMMMGEKMAIKNNKNNNNKKKNFVVQQHISSTKTSIIFRYFCLLLFGIILLMIIIRLIIINGRIQCWLCC